MQIPHVFLSITQYLQLVHVTVLARISQLPVVFSQFLHGQFLPVILTLYTGARVAG